MSVEAAVLASLRDELQLALCLVEARDIEALQSCARRTSELLSSLPHPLAPGRATAGTRELVTAVTALYERVVHALDGLQRETAAMAAALRNEHESLGRYRPLAPASLPLGPLA